MSSLARVVGAGLFTVLSVSCGGGGATSRPPARASQPAPRPHAAPATDGGALVVGVARAGDIDGVAWSPRGDVVVATTSGGALAWQVATGRVIGALNQSLSGSGARFDPAGDRVLVHGAVWDLRDDGRTTFTRFPFSWTGTVSTDLSFAVAPRAGAPGTVDLTDPSGHVLRHVDGLPVESDYPLASAVDGPLVVCTETEVVFTGPDGRARARAPAPTDEGWESRACAMSPDGGRVVAPTSDGRVFLFDARDGRTVRELDAAAGEERERAFVFSRDGTRFVMTEQVGGAVRLTVFDAETGAKRAAFDAAGASIDGVAIAPNGARVAAAGMDVPIAVFDVSTGRRVASLDVGTTAGPTVAAFDPSAERLAVGVGAAVVVFDVATGRATATWRAPPAMPDPVMYDFLGSRAALVIYRQPGLEVVDAEGAHTDPACTGRAGAFESDDAGVYVATDTTVCDLAHGVHTPLPGTRVASSSDGRWVLVADPAGALLRVDVLAPAQHVPVGDAHGPRVPTADVGDVKITDDGARVVSVEGRALTIWTVGSRRRPVRVTAPFEPSLGIRLVGPFVALRGMDRHWALLDAETGAVAVALDDVDGDVQCRAAPGSQDVACVLSPLVQRSADWRLVRARRRVTPAVTALEPHVGPLLAVEWSRDGSRLWFRTGTDVQVHASSGALLRSVQGMGAVSDDGLTAVTCIDGTLTVTTLDDQDPRDLGPCSPPLHARLTHDGAFVGIIDQRGPRYVRLRDGRTFAFTPTSIDGGFVVADDEDHFDVTDEALAPAVTWRTTRAIVGAHTEDASAHRVRGLLGQLATP